MIEQTNTTTRSDDNRTYAVEIDNLIISIS